MKIFFTILLFVVGLQANILLQKVENLIGEESYLSHKNLIDFLFKNEQNYILADGKLNYLAIFKVLKQNGLLNLKLPSAQEIEIEFQTSNDPIKSLKILNDTLKSLGYYYFFTKKIQKKPNGLLIWNISLQTQFIIDPLVFITEIIKNGGKIFEINKEENNKWTYKIDTKFANIAEAIFINQNESKKLQKPLRPYFIKIDGGNTIDIISSPQDRWFSSVVFYDKHLNLLSVQNNEKYSRRLFLNIPQNTRYIKLDDKYTLDNIKRGLTVIIK